MYFYKKGSRFYFIYYDPYLKTNIRLKKNEHPRIETEEAAKKFCEERDSENYSLRNEIGSRTKWQKTQPMLGYRIDIYGKYRKKEAPYSWHKDVRNLEYHILPYFVTMKGKANFDHWPHHFNEFRHYLEGLKPMKTKAGQDTFSYSTMNHIIKSLNSFMRMLKERNETKELYKCKLFPKKFLNEKGEESVIEPIEQRIIREALYKRRPLSSDFFHVSLHTGMRINELIGLSMADFFPDAPVVDKVVDTFAQCGLTPQAYIILESQPVDRTKPRDHSGEIPIKPLKSKGKISGKNTRTIPIFDKESVEILARRYEQQRDLYAQRIYGENLKNYLLFDGINANKYYSDLRSVQKKMNRTKFFSPHDTRHTYCTWLGGKVSDVMILQMILGHSSKEMTDKYLHMNARIQRQIKALEQAAVGLRFAS